MFKQITIAEAESLIAGFRFARPIRFIDTHHTYRPHKAQWRGGATVDAMANFHRSTLGWSGIGQHWTIGPDGSVWTGRDLNQFPCSQTGFNAGALMYELVGNFCAPDEEGTFPPYDTLDAAQLEAAVAVSAAVLARFKLPLTSVRFHRQLRAPGRPPPKTCPGASVDYDWFVDLVEERCWSRWKFDPAGGETIEALTVFDASEAEGSSHDLIAGEFVTANSEARLA